MLLCYFAIFHSVSLEPPCYFAIFAISHTLSPIEPHCYFAIYATLLFSILCVSYSPPATLLLVLCFLCVSRTPCYFAIHALLFLTLCLLEPHCYFAILCYFAISHTLSPRALLLLCYLSYFLVFLEPLLLCYFPHFVS